MSEEKLIYEIAAKVDIMWSGMKIVYALIATQIVATVISIVRNGNGKKAESK